LGKQTNKQTNKQLFSLRWRSHDVVVRTLHCKTSRLWFQIRIDTCICEIRFPRQITLIHMTQMWLIPRLPYLALTYSKRTPHFRQILFQRLWDGKIDKHKELEIIWHISSNVLQLIYLPVFIVHSYKCWSQPVWCVCVCVLA